MTSIAITGMGLTGVIRMSWVHDNLAHVLDHSRTDETTGTWTGLACPEHGLATGTEVDVRQRSAGLSPKARQPTSLGKHPPTSLQDTPRSSRQRSRPTTKPTPSTRSSSGRESRRFGPMHDPAGLFGDTPRGVRGSGGPVVHDLLRGRFPSPGRRMVWSCRCSRGPGRMFLSSLRG
jgi:hypothetical protein